MMHYNSCSSSVWEIVHIVIVWIIVYCYSVGQMCIEHNRLRTLDDSSVM